MTEADLITQSNASIENIRKGNFTLTVLDRYSRPVKNTKVTINQINHSFLFGCGTGSIEKPAVQNAISGVFNYATLGLFWKLIETSPGVYDFSFANLIVDWCTQKGIKIKGHPLLWGFDFVIPDWALPIPSYEQLRNHLTKIVNQFKSKINIWDVVNEPLHQYRFDPISPYTWIKELQPDSISTINEYDVLTGDFPQFLDALKSNSSIPYEVVGLQAHTPPNKVMELVKLNEEINKFAILNKDVHITEITVDSDKQTIVGSPNYTKWDEATQAVYLDRLYRVLFGNPLVKAITYWEVIDGDPWRPASGLLRIDGTAKPAYNALKNLIKTEWWTNTTITTDSSGKANFRGFYGQYNVTINNKKFTIDLKNKSKTIVV